MLYFASVDDKQEVDKDNPTVEDEPEEEEQQQEEEFLEEPPTPLKAETMPTMPTVIKPTIHSATAYKYKDDEKKWNPIFKSSKFISNGYHREELIVEPPASFDGSDGTYQVSFDNNNSVLVLKVAPNLALSDPHDINGYYRQKYGIITAADSARDQAFKASAKGLTDKWYTFRHQLEWSGKPSEDLDGMMPWLDFADIDSQGRVFPLLIINLSSIKPIEEKQRKISGGLRRNKFKSPPKVKGVNMSADPTAQMAAMLEDMIASGTMTPEMKRAVRKFGLVNEDDMDTNEDDITTRESKRRNNDNGTVFSSSDALL